MKTKEAEELAIELIAKHLPSMNWQFVWGNKINALGTCNYRKKHIILSRRWVIASPVEVVLDTIIHEIAHALTPGNKHGAIWRSTFKELGGTGERTASKKLAKVGISRDHVALPTHHMVDQHGTVIQKYYRKPKQSTYDKIDSYYANGRKAETLGKLRIVETDFFDLL